MGCISSKLLSSVDLPVFSGATKPISATNDGDLPNHTVSLTSSTYGVLNLDPLESLKHEASAPNEFHRSPPSIIIPKAKKMSFTDPSMEIINWVLGEDLEDAGPPSLSPVKKPSIRPPALFTPSPKFQLKFFGKENNTPRRRPPVTDPNRVLKPLIFSEKKQHKTPQSMSVPKKSGSRRSLSPLFDPDLVSFYERELHEEAEQIKQIVHPTIRNWKQNDATSFLRSFEEKCPPGGEKAVVLYTTTLRGIRKTYEECNLVRSVIESYNVCVIERDVSMDSGFKEELRMLMGSKEAKLPVLFVKGRIVGGAAEVVRLEEESKLELLIEGIPQAASCCEDCGGLRFVMCKECNGSCMVLVEEEKKKMKCRGCNENGLVYCPSCSQRTR